MDIKEEIYRRCLLFIMLKNYAKKTYRNNRSFFRGSRDEICSENLTMLARVSVFAVIIMTAYFLASKTFIISGRLTDICIIFIGIHVIFLICGLYLRYKKYRNYYAVQTICIIFNS